MSASRLASRTCEGAATLALAASSALPHEVLRTSRGPRKVAPVASGYERFLRSCESGVSRLAGTICKEGRR